MLESLVQIAIRDGIASGRSAHMTSTIIPRVVVVQMGARHNYTIARMLQQRSSLVGLITDFAWMGESKHAHYFNPIARRIGAVERRRIVGLAPERVRAIWGASVLAECSRWMGIEGDKLSEKWFDMRSGRLWLDNANIIYSMFGSGGHYIRRARQNGLLVASEIFITPIAHRIVAEERRRFPGWDRSIEGKSVELIESHVRDTIDMSHLLICPSETVIDGLRSYRSFDESRAVVIPYGHAFVRQQESAPQAGRILFVGSAILRKGIHYLAMAASIVKERAPHFRVFIAGQVTAHVQSKPECRYLHFLGQLGPHGIAAEFGRADVFVLPTLAEGSASVINEALAAGIPVVTTRAAGSIVRNGVEGLIVPERDPEALAEAILYIASNRQVRAEMGLRAKDTILARNQQRWGAELIEALTTLLDAPV